MSLPRFYEDLWELSTTEVALSVDWVREGYVRCVVREGISGRGERGIGLLGDVGCGTGPYVREFSRALERDFLALDVSSKALLQCRRQLREEDEARCRGLVQGDSARLPLASDTFASLFCAHVLEHIPEDDDTLAELNRVLGRGGSLRLIVPNSLDRMFPLFRPLERRLGSLGHLREYSLDSLKRQMESHGFRVHRIYYSDFLLAWMLFRSEETLRSLTRRSGLVRRLNGQVSRRRLITRVLALASGLVLYWENRVLRGCSWGMNICCLGEKVEGESPRS